MAPAALAPPEAAGHQIRVHLSNLRFAEMSMLGHNLPRSLQPPLLAPPPPGPKRGITRWADSLDLSSLATLFLSRPNQSPGSIGHPFSPETHSSPKPCSLSWAPSLGVHGVAAILSCWLFPRHLCPQGNSGYILPPNLSLLHSFHPRNGHHHLL